MDMQQEKAKKSYRNKKRIYLFLVSCEAAQTDKSVFIYSPPSNKFLTQDCSVGAAETAAPPKEGSS